MPYGEAHGSSPMRGRSLVDKAGRGRSEEAKDGQSNIEDLGLFKKFCKCILSSMFLSTETPYHTAIDLSCMGMVALRSLYVCIAGHVSATARWPCC